MAADATVPTLIVQRDGDSSRPSLENRVAFQWEQGLDTLGYRSATIRDEVTLNWGADVLRQTTRPALAVDIGCAYGNYLLMLNAKMGLDQQIAYTGIDIDERGLSYGRGFAASVDGYANCEFVEASIETGLPIDDGSVDLLVANDMLEHLPDVAAALREMARVTSPTGRVIISTPLADSLFKRIAAMADRLAQGRLYKAYYRGKDTEIDAEGNPIMEVHAGHDHISEMRYDELLSVLHESGWSIHDRRLMPIMSGSRWFDRHPTILAGLLTLEALQERLRRPSWSHGICLLLRHA